MVFYAASTLFSVVSRRFWGTLLVLQVLSWNKPVSRNAKPTLVSARDGSHYYHYQNLWYDAAGNRIRDLPNPRRTIYHYIVLYRSSLLGYFYGYDIHVKLINRISYSYRYVILINGSNLALYVGKKKIILHVCFNIRAVIIFQSLLQKEWRYLIQILKKCKVRNIVCLCFIARWFLYFVIRSKSWSSQNLLNKAIFF